MSNVLICVRYFQLSLYVLETVGVTQEQSHICQRAAPGKHFSMNSNPQASACTSGVYKQLIYERLLFFSFFFSLCI